MGQNPRNATDNSITMAPLRKPLANGLPQPSRILRVHIPVKPSVNSSVDHVLAKILPYVVKACEEQGFKVGRHAAIRANVIVCLSHTDADDGAPTLGFGDLDNTIRSVLSATKESIGGPLPTNAQISEIGAIKVAYDSRRVNGKKQPGHGYILELQVFDSDVPCVHSPRLGSFDPNGLLKHFGYPPLIATKASPIVPGQARRLELFVEGPTNIGGSNRSSQRVDDNQIKLFQRDIWKAFEATATEIGFPLQMDDHFRVSVEAVYATHGARAAHGEEFLPDITDPDLIRRTKIVHDLFCGDPVVRPDEGYPIKNDKIILAFDSMKTILLPVAANRKLRPGLYLGITIAEKPEDFIPHTNTRAFMERCIANTDDALDKLHATLPTSTNRPVPTEPTEASTPVIPLRHSRHTQPSFWNLWKPQAA